MAALTAATNGHAVAVEVDGVRYPSARSAAVVVGVGYSAVTARCHDPRHPNYRWLGATPDRRELRPEDRRIARALVEPAAVAGPARRRRAEVLDLNEGPPKVVRRADWLRCMCCARFTFSDDVVRVRLCEECGGLGSAPAKDA
ncbi:hypothetical protein D3C87_296290 [compost metagenome]